METYLSSSIDNEIIKEFTPKSTLEFAAIGSLLSDGENDYDVSDWLVLNAFNEYGESKTKALLCIGESVLFYPSQEQLSYSFANFEGHNKPLWVTFDLGKFFALEHAGIQCAYLIPEYLRKDAFLSKNIDKHIDNIFKSGMFDDVRLLVSASDIETANKYLNESNAKIYFTDEPIQAYFTPDYTAWLIEKAHDATTEKTQPEKEHYDAWRLKRVSGKNKTLIENYAIETKRSTVANLAFTIASNLEKLCPAFYSINEIESILQENTELHLKTRKSIMRRIAFIVGKRRAEAIKAIQAGSWGKHNYLRVDSLEGLKIDTNVTLITAPTGAGKTKHVITPFRQLALKDDVRFMAIAPLRSLVREMSDKLKTEYYEDIKTQSQAMLTESMSVCLPSIMSIPLRPFVDRVEYVAIDEISQNLRYIAKGKISVKGANREDVYDKLKDLVSNCNKIVAADASIDDMTLSFMERCRPDEKFTIVEQVPADTGRECHLYEDIGDLLGEITIALNSGKNIWIASESKNRAKAIERFLMDLYPEIKIMLVCGDNSGNEEQEFFTSNIEDECVKYQVVIASPSISSGVSIEGHNGKHFDMIFGVAGGNSIAPTDLMQMLARVRYVKDYHVCLMVNNIKKTMRSVKSVLKGQKLASELEGQKMKINDFTEFMAKVDLDLEIYRSDFSNGFYWVMEFYKFTIVQHKSTDIYDYFKDAVKDANKALEQERIESIIFAPVIESGEALKLENKQNKTEAEKYTLEAFKIKSILSLNNHQMLTIEDIKMAEGAKKLARYLRYKGHKSKNNDAEKNIALRRFDQAQIDAYQMLFGDMDLSEFRYTQHEADQLLDVIIENRFLFSALGIVPKNYGAWIESMKDGEMVVSNFKKPASSVKEINKVFELMGLNPRRREGTDKERFYDINPESIAMMEHYAKLKTAS
ncbi:MAG: hypothetical protein [Caudoviricetes sp.]|nr:MAG: hypothetical protein [Caudoviricetes sp.]